MPAQREDWVWEEELMQLGWYDGPLDGWATHAGAVVYYSSDGSGEHHGQRVYALTQVPGAALLHIEVIARCWDRWRASFQAGETTLDTHPTLPEDRAVDEVSYRVLAGLLAGREATRWAVWIAPTGPHRTAVTSAPRLLRWAQITHEEHNAALERGYEEDEEG